MTFFILHFVEVLRATCIYIHVVSGHHPLIICNERRWCARAAYDASSFQGRLEDGWLEPQKKRWFGGDNQYYSYINIFEFRIILTVFLHISTSQGLEHYCLWRNKIEEKSGVCFILWRKVLHLSAMISNTVVSIVNAENGCCENQKSNPNMNFEPRWNIIRGNDA